MFDIDFFTPIINLPQSAILGVGRITDEPVVAGGQVVPGKVISLSLTFDHRVIDGAPAARWLQRLAQGIGHPPDQL
jgi:pyruvate dehydrogenase E2 component (dihydrolipoamide acetyltransferase)